MLTSLLSGSPGYLRRLQPPQMKHVSDQELHDSLDGAAPANVLANATVLNVMPDGTMKTVREGTNGWTCWIPIPAALR
jgi:hypothetical protein